MAPQFHAIQYGVDDLTLGFDMEGSPSVRDLDASPGLQARRGKMLGERTSWGRWAHLLGRSVSSGSRIRSGCTCKRSSEKRASYARRERLLSGCKS
jgi:hypothetical protein